MSLQEKVLNLKLNAALAVKHAQGWQRLIDLYGEEKATAFYTHLGLNHLEKKSFEWEGLRLSREPKEHEKIAVKGIANAQESAKETIGKILLSLREELIADGVKRIKKLKPATYHELILQASKESRSSLRDRLVKVHRQGRSLVAAELAAREPQKTFSISNAPHRCHFTESGLMVACTCAATKEALPEDEFDDLDMLTDLTGSRVANDVQSRIIDAAARHALLGQTGDGLINAVTNEINGGSVTYIDRAAAGLANKVIGIGRSDEMGRRSDDIERYEYSSLLDVNTCSNCAELDGTTATSMDDLPEVPLADCDGGPLCRCFIIAIAV